MIITDEITNYLDELGITAIEAEENTIVMTSFGFLGDFGVNVAHARAYIEKKTRTKGWIEGFGHGLVGPNHSGCVAIVTFEKPQRKRYPNFVLGDK